MFAAAAGGGTIRAGRSGIHPAVAPQPGEVVIIKRRVSAFTGSDLVVLLSAGDIDTLVLAGAATSGVVLSAVRQAADPGYQLTVVSDGCLDTDPEVHRGPDEEGARDRPVWPPGRTGSPA